MYRMMIVEDEAVIALQLKRSVKAMGYDVIAMANTGVQAVKEARRLHPDLVLMDIVMPGKVDGVTSAEIMKREMGIPVIFLTAYADNEIIERAKQVEPHGYIVKPFKEKEVKAVIEIALHRMELERRLKYREMRYALATQAGRVGVWEWCLKTNRLFLDPILKNLLGFDAGESETRLDDWVRLIHPQDRARVRREARAYLNGSRPWFEVEHRMLAKDGAVRWFLTRGQILQGNDGGSRRLLGSHTDITELKLAEERLQQYKEQLEELVRKRTENLEMSNRRLEREAFEHRRTAEALQQSEQTLRALLDAIPESVSLLDSQGGLIEANETFRLRHSITDTAYVGSSAYDHLSPDLVKERKKRVGAVIRKGCPVRYEDQFNDRTVDTIIYPVFDQDGRVIRLAVLGLDVTEAKAAETELRAQEEKLTAQSQHLEEVNAALRVLLRQREEDRREFGDTILANATQLVLPYLASLKETHLTTRQETLISIVEANLKNILSPFASRLSSGLLNLTPREIRVAHEVKEGRTNKEIAQHLGLSENTVLFHRYNIRSKLGLKGSGINLRTYLLSMEH